MAGELNWEFFGVNIFSYLHLLLFVVKCRWKKYRSIFDCRKCQIKQCQTYSYERERDEEKQKKKQKKRLLFKMVSGLDFFSSNYIAFIFASRDWINHRVVIVFYTFCLSLCIFNSIEVRVCVCDRALTRAWCESSK